MSINERRFKILKAIVEQFIESTVPVPSSRIVARYSFQISPATIRNEMMYLENLGLIIQPHTSAGRVPTDAGIRLFVDELMDDVPAKRLAHLQVKRDGENLKPLLKEAVKTLAGFTDSLAFACWDDDIYYRGVAGFLNSAHVKNEQQDLAVINFIEDEKRFKNYLTELMRSGSVSIIGDEHRVKKLKNTCLFAVSLDNGILGIIGHKCMNYSMAVSALGCVRDSVLNSLSKV